MMNDEGIESFVAERRNEGAMNGQGEEIPRAVANRISKENLVLIVVVSSVLIALRSFLCTIENDGTSFLKCPLENLDEWLLIILYLFTAFVSIVFFCLTPTEKHHSIGSTTEHCTATAIGLCVIWGEGLRCFLLKSPTDSCTPFLEKVRMFCLMVFTVTNIVYVYKNGKIPRNRWGRWHQSLHLALSIYIAYHAMFREVAHIAAHVKKPHQNGPEELWDDLSVFLFALNFEFHILLANYAIITLRETTGQGADFLEVIKNVLWTPFSANTYQSIYEKICAIVRRPAYRPIPDANDVPQDTNAVITATNCRDRRLRCAFFVILFLDFVFCGIIVLFYVLDKDYFLSYWKAESVTWGIAVLLSLMFVLSLLLVCLPQRVENPAAHHRDPIELKRYEHENKVIIVATIGLFVVNLCSILYDVQVLVDPKKNVHDDGQKMPNFGLALAISAISSVQIFFQTTFLTKHDHSRLKDLEKMVFALFLLLLNGVHFTNNLVETFQIGIHWSAYSGIGSLNFFIFTRAIASFAVFYRLASFFRLCDIVWESL